MVTQVNPPARISAAYSHGSMSPLQQCFYHMYCKLLRGVIWSHKPEYRARLLARCWRSLEAYL